MEMREKTSVKKGKKGRPKCPPIEIANLNELKKEVRAIKKRKKGLYHRRTKGLRKKRKG